MDEIAHSARQEPGASEAGHRKESLSGKLNKLTNNTFIRRRASGTNASSDSVNNLPRRTCIPTPSLGSRTSSLFAGLGLHSRGNTDPSGTPLNDQKGAAIDSSTASTRRYSRQVSESTSSFFGDNSSGPLYPREFLETPAVGTERKENRNRNSKPTQDVHPPEQLQPDQQQRLSSQNLGPEVPQSNSTNKTTDAAATRNTSSEIATQGTIKKSRRISDRLANTPFFKQHSVRHSIAAVPLTSSGKVTDGESGVKIEERRLMAPIDPPLPRSTTIDRISLPRTPNFMRPTSSSAARRSGIPNAFTSPPMSSAIEPGQRTADMPGFLTHRERKRAAQEAAMTLGSPRISHESTPGFLPGNGPQIMARNRAGTVQERAMTFGVPEHWARQNLPTPPPRVPDPTTSAEADFNSRARRDVAMSPQRYPHGPRYGSITELNAAYDANGLQPPVPPVTQQLIDNGTLTGNGGQRRQFPHFVAQGSRIPRSTSNTADLQYARGVNRALGIQPSTSEYHLPILRNDKLPPSIPDNSYMEHRATPITFPVRKASRAAATHAFSSKAVESAAARSSTTPQSIRGAAPANNHSDDDEVDLTLIRSAQDLCFWAGRYTAVSDGLRNGALLSPEAAGYAHNDEQRQRVALQHLAEKCADEEARESLDAFVRAWAHGWTGGVAEAFLGVAPESIVPAAVVEEKKKSSFMGKVFGRRKS
ncbi:MAG: hypothetical protein Q9213_000401 [Squamulea squamosa]